MSWREKQSKTGFPCFSPCQGAQKEVYGKGYWANWYGCGVCCILQDTAWLKAKGRWCSISVTWSGVEMKWGAFIHGMGRGTNPCESNQVPLWGEDAWIRKVFAFIHKAQADCQPGCSILLLQISE